MKALIAAVIIWSLPPGHGQFDGLRVERRDCGRVVHFIRNGQPGWFQVVCGRGQQ